MYFLLFYNYFYNVSFYVLGYENIFQRKQKFKAEKIEKNHFICKSGKITNSISQGQNIEFVVAMLKSNVEWIHKRKGYGLVLSMFMCLGTIPPIPFHEQTPRQPQLPTT